MITWRGLGAQHTLGGFHDIFQTFYMIVSLDSFDYHVIDGDLHFPPYTVGKQ